VPADKGFLAVIMAKKKRKKKKTKLPESGIPKSASTVRFLIFLAIGLILFVVFMVYAASGRMF